MTSRLITGANSRVTAVKSANNKNKAMREHRTLGNRCWPLANAVGPTIIIGRM